MKRLTLLISACLALPLWADNATLTIQITNHSSGTALAWDQAYSTPGTWTPTMPEGADANVDSLASKTFKFTTQDNRGHSVSAGWGQYDSDGNPTHQCIGKFSFDNVNQRWIPDNKTKQLNCELKPLTAQSKNATFTLKMYDPMLHHKKK